MRLWLLRHPRPLVAPGLCYGRLDLPADAGHLAQTAQALCDTLQREGVRPEGLRSSPLQRCTALGQALSRQLELTLQVDERLAEMHFGIWEGVPWADIPKAAVDAWTADFARHAFGGRENTQQVLERVWSALGQARLAGGEQLWVTHAGVIRAVRHLLRRGAPRIDRADEWPREAPGHGQWTSVEL